MSRFVSLGNKADLNETDFLSAWGEDDDTSVIMAYLEDIKDGQTFMETARRVTKNQARDLHQVRQHHRRHSGGVLAHRRPGGAEAAYNAAFRQVGVIRAHTIEDLFDFSGGLRPPALIRDDGVCIITNAGGPGVMAAVDASRARRAQAGRAGAGDDGAPEGEPAVRRRVLNPVDAGRCPGRPVRNGPEDGPEDPNVNAVVVILTPQLVTQPLETAKAVAEIAKDRRP